MVSRENHIDVLIAGGGFAGLTLAIALRQALGPGFSVALADPTLGKSHADDERASAIVASVRRLFDALGLWQDLAGQAQPILDMAVTDSRLDDAMRPTFLTFGREVEPGEPFAHMIENRFLIGALEAKARDLGVDLRATAVKDFPPPERGRSNAKHSGGGGADDPSPDRLQRSDPPLSGEGFFERRVRSRAGRRSVRSRVPYEK
jgi:2-octaprenyl-6-methoxyphenol hydroxylase